MDLEEINQSFMDMAHEWGSIGFSSRFKVHALDPYFVIVLKVRPDHF